MSWRDRYRQASFRGVEFFVESSDSTHGRRQAVHEHAQRDVPYTEDMGRRAREWTIDGYLIGDDYDLQRDRLQEACETAGPGQLVHPYRGELTVECRGLTIRESTQDGRMCRVSLAFLEAGEQKYPREVVDSVNAIGTASGAVVDAASAGFVERFLTDGFPAFVRDAAASRVQQFAEFMESPGYPFGADIQAASDFLFSARDLASDALALVLQPAQLASRMVGLIGDVRSAFGGNSFSVLDGLYASFGASYGGKTSTPGRIQQGANFNAIGELVRQAAIAQEANEAVVTVYPSYQDAIAVRDTMLDAIDEESERTTSDDAYVAITGLRSQIVQGIPDPAESLPQLLDYTPRSTLPSLLVAYSLYGDAGRDAEIVARNKPRHPGFMPGGQPLEVLSDG